MSDSAVGLTVPATRQNGTSTVILSCEPRRADIVNGGTWNSADFTDHRASRAPARPAQAVRSDALGPFFVCAGRTLLNSRNTYNRMVRFIWVSVPLRVKTSMPTATNECPHNTPVRL